MENNYPKDPIEEGMPPLDLEDDGYYADDEDFFIDSLDDEDPYPHWDMPFDDDEDDLDNYDEDIFDDLEGLDESDLY